MKPSTLSSTADHEIHFGQFISKLTEKFQPIQVFSFFKSSSQQTSMSCFHSGKAYSSHNYCLLVVTASSTRIDYELQDYANRNYDHGTLTIICHGNQTVWEAIDANSRFFKTIYTNSQLLYSHDGYLCLPFVQRYVPTNAGQKAMRHYSHRMPLAEGFLSGAKKCLIEERWGVCTFMLHQAIEQTCILLIRILLAYRSEFHNLRRLLGLCDCANERPHQIFLESAETRRLLDLLCKSYSSARYSAEFKVSAVDANTLYEMVENFISLASEICEQKMEELNHAEANHNPCVTN